MAVTSGRHAHRTLRSTIARLATISLSATFVFAAVASEASAVAPAAKHFKAAKHPPTEQRQVRSLRTAATFAKAHPRKVAASKHLNVKVAHPAKAGAAPAPRTTVGAPAPKPRVAVVTPDVASITTFAGLSQAESGGIPPDPWISVSPSFVVQSVNSMIRVSNRAGGALLTIPTWALFALPSDQDPTDPRIIWDATHGRWVGVLSSFNFDDSLDYLNIAVSDGADPLGGWTTFAYSYTFAFPDFPAIASSNDKIVITDDLFDDTEAFIHSEITILTWASILAGGPLTQAYCTDSTLLHPRPALVLSASNDVHLVSEAGADGAQWYDRISGTTCASIVDDTNLTADLGFAPFATPPDARQTPADTLVDAMDERPTDAVWQNGNLWWVSTYPVSYDGDVTFNDEVVLWNMRATTGAPTSPNAVEISAGDGVDDFMGGIGMSRSGVLFVSYSESSSADPIATWVNRYTSADGLGTPLNIDTGDASYGKERWGDFVGVAIDPIGTGTVWQANQVATADGAWRTTVTRLIVDGDDPTVPGKPTQTLVIPSTLGPLTVPMRIAWTPSTDAASGTVTYQLSPSIDGSSFESPSTVSGPSTVRPLLLAHAYTYAVQARDPLGHGSGYNLQTYVFHPTLYQQTSGTVYTGTWSTSSSSGYSGGSVRYASTAGRYATFTATGARSIAIVTTKAKTRGSFKVYIDNVYKGTISTYSTTTKYRQLVYQFSWSTPGTHKVKIVVKGTSGHPRVDLDAFVVVK